MSQHCRSYFKILLFAFVTAVVNTSLVGAESNPQKYKIGIIIPLSGQVASLGHYVKNGIELAFEKLPPEDKKLLELRYEDDQFNPTKTISAYRRLMSSGGIDVAFVIGSTPANALSPIVEKEKVLLFAIGASDPGIAIGKEYSFTHWVVPSVLGNKLAEELIRKDFKRIAFVTGEAPGSVADTTAAVEALKSKKHGHRVVYNETFATAVTDYRTPLLQMRQQKTDAVVAVLFPGALSSFAKQFRASGLNAQLIGMETFEDENEVKIAEGALNNTWYANASDPTPEFISEYRAKYAEHPGWGSGNGYDAIKIFAQAVRGTGNDMIKIRDHLKSLKDFTGACGTYSASGDNRFMLPAALKRVTDKGFEAY